MTRRTLSVAVAALAAAVFLGGNFTSSAAAPPRVSAYPGPGDSFAGIKTQVSLRGVALGGVGPVAITGSRTGRRQVSLRAHSDGKGASALVDRPFAPGETVTVNTGLNIRGARNGDYRFRVGPRSRPISAAKAREVGGNPPKAIKYFRSRPDLRPPRVFVDRRGRGFSGGKVFLAPKVGPGQNGPMIVDNNGEVVWFHPLPAGFEADGFRPQRYDGHTVLTWWEGFSNYGVGNGVGRVYDTSYRPVTTIRAGNGYDGIDPHEFRFTKRGTALLAIQTLIYRDLRSIGGPKKAQVFDAIVQEVDPKTGLVLYEWHSLDHVPISETKAKPPKVTGHIFDYFHVNSIDKTGTGDYLVSARNTWTVYKIDRYTGRVRWRLGGKHSSFKMGPRTHFAWQHDARVQRSGVISLFDNSAAPPVARYSRGIGLRIGHGRARLVKSYRHSRNLLSGSQGDLQRLAKGNAFIGWGQNPYWSEYSPHGRELYSARLSKGNMSYRVFRFGWSGRSASPPAIATKGSGRSARVYASWNGATGVGRWVALGGDRPGALKPVASAARRGFETRVNLRRGYPYVAVQAVGRNGKVMSTSRTVRAAR